MKSKQRFVSVSLEQTKPVLQILILYLTFLRFVSRKYLAKQAIVHICFH